MCSKTLQICNTMQYLSSGLIMAKGRSSGQILRYGQRSKDQKRPGTEKIHCLRGNDDK